MMLSPIISPFWMFAAAIMFGVTVVGTVIYFMRIPSKERDAYEVEHGDG